MRITVSQIYTDHNTNEIEDLGHEENKKDKQLQRVKPIKIRNIANIEAENRDLLRLKILDLLTDEALDPILLELDSDARNSFRIVTNTDITKGKFSDESFLVGRSFKLNDPMALFEIIVKTINRNSKFNEEKELIRIIGTNLHEVVEHRKYFLQLSACCEPVSSATNRIPDTVSVWPKEKQLSTGGSKEERLRLLRQKIRTQR